MSDRIRLRALYLCYLSLEDPLVHTQVIAYLRGLAQDGHRIHLLTFEPGRLTRRERNRWRQTLAAQGIAWHGLRYHKRPSLPATLYDALVGAVYAYLLLRRHRLEALHARAHVPAAMALISIWLAGSRRPALIFDIRGLMAEEYEDAGLWALGSVPSRLTKAVQAAAIRRATAIVVLTERVRSLLFGDAREPRIQVIPCCADIDALGTAPEAGDRMRAELGLDNATVMVYVGKFSGWYMEREMVEFFAVARRQLEGLHFLILTQGDRDEIRHELLNSKVGEEEYTIASAVPERIGEYLSAADFAISFIRPARSKIASSPTKIGEYLAAGLPIVSTAGVGDLDRLLTTVVGSLVDEHSEAAYRDAVAQIERLVADPATAERCRELARRELSLKEVGIPRYRAVYEHVAEPSASAIANKRQDGRATM